MTNTFPDTMHLHGEPSLTLRRTEEARRAERRPIAREATGPKMRPWRKGEALVGLVVLAVAAWHFVPLPRRVEVTNTTGSTMQGVVLRVGDEELTAGDLAAGQTVGHTFFQRRKLGSGIEALAMIDGARQSLGHCGYGLLSASRTRISLENTGIDGCRPEHPRIGHLP